jgi:hypothetical protein
VRNDEEEEPADTSRPRTGAEKATSASGNKPKFQLDLAMWVCRADMDMGHNLMLFMKRHVIVFLDFTVRRICCSATPSDAPEGNSPALVSSKNFASELASWESSSGTLIHDVMRAF